MRIKSRKWAKNTENEILSYKYLASLLTYEYGVGFNFGENPTNYAHKVWLKNRKNVSDDYIVTYQNKIEEFIEDVMKSRAYVVLSEGKAPTQLKLDTEMRYDYAKKSKC